MRIGVDIDGVLADFNTPFIERVIQVTGKDLFPPRPFDIPTWNYPEHYGYTTVETSLVWDSITSDPWFWGGLPAYDTTALDLEVLDRQVCKGHDLYFITSRPGLAAKYQTERWLRNQYNQLQSRPSMFTVLISSAKGLCAAALKLDYYIDDRSENITDVEHCTDATAVFLMDRPWNHTHILSTRCRRVSSVREMFRS